MTPYTPPPKGYPVPAEPRTILAFPAPVKVTTDFIIRAVANPGKKVFLLADNKVVEREVKAIRVHIVTPPSQVRMGFDIKIELCLEDEEGDHNWHNQEGVCYATKADLLASL